MSLPGPMRRFVSQVLAGLSFIVPRERRADWREEWNGEFDYHARRVTGARPMMRLLLRLGGACLHAFALRRDRLPMSGLAQDLRLAGRTLVRQPTLTAAIGITFALGIGANAAVFAVLRGSLLRPLAVPGADRVVVAREINASGAPGAFSYPDYVDWTRASTTVTGGALFSKASAIATGVDDADRVQVTSTTPGLFGLGGFDIRGRTFSEDDQLPDAERVVIVSAAFARREFGGRDPIGATFSLDGVGRRVVGVAAEDVLAPVFAPATDVWTPLLLRPQVVDGRGNRNFSAIARLDPGARTETASREFAALMASLADRYPQTNARRTGEVVTLPDALASGARRSLGLASLVTVIVLLTACANVAGLLLVRNMERGREFAVRTALGASRVRLARQVLVESLVLAGAGALAGFGVLAVGTGALRAVLPDALPRRETIGIDPVVVSAGFALAVIAALAAGLPAAWNAASGSAAASSSRHTGDGLRLRRLLVGAQLACAVLLLVIGGLLAVSFGRLQRVDPGFPADRVVTMQMLVPSRIRTPDAAIAFVDGVLDAVKARPGVDGAALMGPAPFSGDRNRWDVSVIGLEHAPVKTDRYTVTDGAFALMGIDLVAGRLLGGADFTTAGSRVAVVDEQFTRIVLGGRNPIGREVQLDRNPPITIVGVVRHVKHYGLDEDPRAQLYVPFAYDPAPWLNIVIGGRGDGRAILADTRRAVLAVAPDAPPYQATTLGALVDRSLADRRLASTLAGSLAIIALAVAAAGLYGAMSFSVERRGREIGVRAALGATRANLMRLVFGEAARAVVPGLGAGLVAGALGVRVVRSLLFETTALDLPTYAGVIAVLAIVASLAAYGPARRAASVDPASVLRD